MFTALIWNYAFSSITDRFVVKQMDQEMDQYYRSLVQGVYAVLTEDIKGVPHDQWEDYIKGRRAQFGYPLAIEPINSLKIDTTDREMLEKGEIVVGTDGTLYHQRLGNYDQVLTMGPIEDFSFPVRIEALFWCIITIYFLIMAMLWALPFWLKLRRISTAAESFGQGDFSARAKMTRHSALYPLANSFNKMAAKIEHLIASHKELTRAVSHELRTPISRIRFGMEMLETTADASERHIKITDINTDVDELDTLVSELLVYARFDREKPSLDLTKLPVVPWLRELVAKTETLHTDIRFTLPDSPPMHEYTVQADPYYMSRAVYNLIQNAMKYAEHRVALNIEQKDGKCIIHVDDDGPGVPEADREHIFDPFVRLDSSRSRDTGGHGLGLAIVRQVIDWHEAQIVVGQSPLGGARFSVILLI